jgi:hypothetical protein
MARPCQDAEVIVALGEAAIVAWEPNDLLLSPDASC